MPFILAALGLFASYACAASSSDAARQIGRTFWSPDKDKQANWLPARGADFAIMLRIYWPKETDPSVLDGSWIAPQVIKTR